MVERLEDVAVELFRRLDALDFDAIRKLTSDEVEGVDEITRGWLRGGDALDAYMRQIEEMGVHSLDSKLSDIHAREWGDAGLVTCWLDQSYVVEGSRQEIHCPTSIVARRHDGGWRIELVHSVPLPEGE